MRLNQNRRDYLKTASLGTAFVLNPLVGFSSSVMHSENKINKRISNVLVLFKTHLDIGFTDYAGNVLKKYFSHFLPVALDLARNSRLENSNNRFIWTTGSWLIYEYLEQANPSDKIIMEQAIEAGDVIWHGLPFTSHTELMSSSLMHAGIHIAKVLDNRFGKRTIAAKMTDVPGHTRSLVPVFHQEGIEMLHIGVNPASSLPDVPPIFNWKAPDGSETMVMYQGNYGGVMVLPDQKTAVSIVFTGDNHGPQSQTEITAIYQSLKQQFPNAVVQASDLNQLTIDLKKQKEHLPVVTGEIGDTWIHGIGSDPLKIAHFREMQRFREDLLNSGELKAGSPEDMAFTTPLSMVAEHTWGMDVKTFLKSWNSYSQDKFEAAIKTEPFQMMEKSWQEKRNYIRTAIESLPDGLNNKANERLKELQPLRRNISGLKNLNLNEPLHTDFFKIEFDHRTGAMVSLLQKESGRNWAGHGNHIGLFTYQTFSVKDYDRFFDQYLRSRPQWALADFGKPGLESANPVSRIWQSLVKAAYKAEESNGIRIFLDSEVLDKQGKTPPGCPAQIRTEMFFPKSESEIQITLFWFNKKATRLPEALWFSFVPTLSKDENWILDKSGQEVDPTDVVRNGARKLHAIQQGIWAGEGEQKFVMQSLDAPLVATGERNLLNFDNAIPAAEDGMHFCLFNNVWGTNFTMWFDDDMKFRFKLML